MPLELVSDNPIEIFGSWYEEAQNNNAELLPDACALATASKAGRPSARMVLLKSFDDRGFVFVTNYSSRKAKDLDENPHAALLFHWESIGGQVRIEGSVARTSQQESEAIFAARPVNSQIAAWASPQSQQIADRAELERKVSEVKARFDGGAVPLPDFWGGYRIAAERIELWIRGDDRLHDRFLFTRSDSGWDKKRLAP